MMMEETIALHDIQAIAASFGASFDIDKIVDTLAEKDGTRYYQVRWVKYSWEPAASFTHLEHLIRDFWSQCGGGIPDNIQDLTSKNDSQQQTKHLAQVISREPVVAVKDDSPSQQDVDSSSRRSEDLPSTSILTPIIEENINDSEGRQIQGDTSNQQIPSNESSHDSAILPTIDHTDFTNQDESPQVQTPQEVSTGSIETNEAGDPNTTNVPGESKKRRKIPGRCDICGKHFKSTTNIAAHKKLHTEERQYECNECGRKFRRKLHLVRHQESHAGIKSYVCDICGSYFSSKWYMQAHAVIHTGDKPYKCDICNKCFNNKANLNKHKLIHENNRPYICTQCGRTYRQSYDLKRHMNTHSGVKNFSCTYCNRSFAIKSYLQRHLLTHVGDKKFSCEICSAKFFQRGHLNYHMKTHHAKNEMEAGDQIPEPFSSTNQSDEHNDDAVAKEDEVENNTVMGQPSNNNDEIISEQTEFFQGHLANQTPILFMSNESSLNNSNPHLLSGKHIYQETFDNASHNLPIAVNNPLTQKCLIIDGNNIVEKRSVILEGCEDQIHINKNNQIDLEKQDEGNQGELVSSEEQVSGDRQEEVGDNVTSHQPQEIAAELLYQF